MERRLVKSLTCSGADGVQRAFPCVITRGSRVYDLTARPPDLREHYAYFVYRSDDELRRSGEHYYAEFVRIDDGRAISRDMQAPEGLRRMGIPDAVILDMARDNVVVSSSSHASPLLPGESRNTDATKVWMRLVGRGLARALSDDRYETRSPAPSEVVCPIWSI